MENLWIKRGSIMDQTRIDYGSDVDRFLDRARTKRGSLLWQLRSDNDKTRGLKNPTVGADNESIKARGRKARSFDRDDRQF